MRKVLEGTFLIVLAVGLLYLQRAPLGLFYAQVHDRFWPCSEPIVYSLGKYDERFGISKDQLKSDLSQAAALWNSAAGRPLFVYADQGGMPIDLVYDYRQEATDKLKALGVVVKDDRASYDAVKAQYDTFKQLYTAHKASYDARVEAYESRQSAYNAEVARWNRAGGAPEAQYQALQQEKLALQNELNAIHADEQRLRGDVDAVNALVEELNRIATRFNITASEFNQAGSARGEEFTEGQYEVDSEGARIEIYQFDGTKKLVRVLTHEFGHALSLEHVDDPSAIMYKFNQGDSVGLAATDISALKARCKLE